MAIRKIQHVEPDWESEREDFTNKLREARREKTRVEEEFDQAADRWREEKRRLNAEIDRLDRALQKAQSEARRARSDDEVNDKKFREDLVQMEAKWQQAQAALGQAESRWAAERQELQERIDGLESSLVDAIERSNNPARAEDNREAAALAQLEAGRKEIETRMQAEMAAIRSEAEAAQKAWETERGRLHVQIERLQKQSGAAPAPEAAPAPLPGGDASARGSRLSRLFGATSPAAVPTDAGLEALQQQVAALEQERGTLTQRVGELETAASAARDEAEAARVAAEKMRAEIAARQAQVEQGLEAEKALLVERDRWERERMEFEARLQAGSGASGASSVPVEAAQLESALTASRQQATAIEGQFRIAATEWEQEKQRLREMIAALEQQTAASSAMIEREVHESQLAAAEQSRAELENRLNSEAAAWAEERGILTTRIGELETGLRAAEEARQSSEAALVELQAGAQAAAEARQQIEQQLQAAGEEWRREREAQGARIAELEAAQDSARSRTASAEEELARLRAGLDAAEANRLQVEEQFEATAREWNEEREQFRHKLRKLEASLHEAETAGAADGGRLAAELQEARKAREEMEQKLAALTAEWTSERNGREDELAALQENLQGSTRAAAEAAARVDQMVAELEAARAARTELEAQLQAEAARWTAEKQALAEQLAALENGQARAGETLAGEQAAWSAERAALEARIGELEQNLAEGADRVDPQQLEAVRAEMTARLEAADARCQALETQAQTAAAAWQEEKSAFAARIAEWERRIAEEADRVRKEAQEALTAEYAAKIQELTKAKEQLEARAQSSAAGSAGAPADLAKEIQRVESLIAEITAVIEDPNAALSNVMRKNAERAELEAYRKGLVFSAGS